MRFISLFAGIGGFDLGFERAGMEPAAQVEIDPKCREVLGRHWPHVERHDDVRTFDATRFAGAVDLVCGGFPCQDVSVAGRRAGMGEGTRSGLFYEAVRIVGECRPRWVVLENVPGLLSSRGGEDFRSVLSALDDLGYGVAWRILDSRWFGVPQRRRRVFIVGCLGAVAPAFVALHPECEGCEGDSGEGAEEREASAREADESSGDSGLGLQLRNDRRVSGLLEEASTLRASTRTCNTDLVPNPMSFNWMEGRTFRVYENCTNPLTASQTQAVLDGSIVRSLTPTECERLQGFPDGWTEGFPKGVRYKMIGNAVTVNVANWIGERIKGVSG
jgi:DNA (cytosine-5)-methyltransferase 1